MSIKIKADRAELLETLKTNRKQHAIIVKEAREGYINKAIAALEKRLAQLKEGKLTHLSFALAIPQDHTAVYDTAIVMLERHTDSTIELNAEAVRSLIEDTWDWSRGFIGSTIEYSPRAVDYASKIGQEVKPNVEE